MSAATQYTTTRDAVGTVTGGTTRLVPAEGGAAGPAVPLSIAVLAVVAVVVAAWGAAAPFAGPAFGFVADRFGAWQWSTTSASLAVAPGVLALLAGLWVLGASLRTSYGRRPDMWVLGLIVAACGAWFVVGQYVWPVIYGRNFITASGVNHFMWKELCFAIGPGVILVFCGAMFMGWAVRRQLAVVAERSALVSPIVVPVPSSVPGTVPGAAPVSTTRRTQVAPTTAKGTASVMSAQTTSEQPVVERPVAGDTVVEQQVRPTALPPPPPPA